MKHFPGSDAEAYKAVARQWCSTVTVVTGKRKAEFIGENAPEFDGYTATAFLTVSIDPPLVLVSATNNGSAYALLSQADHFVVNLLDASQESIAGAFAKPSSQRAGNWEEFAYQLDANGAPILLGCMGAYSARVTQLIPAGDHTLVLGEVTEIHQGDANVPLMYFNRAYTKPVNA
ncbi:MAG: flavin reductase family protein [Pleurocapsa sp. SU_196_0]|nr:flavin reductase family protein [Pleurocapsa sp. SU_196_0]